MRFRARTHYKEIHAAAKATPVSRAGAESISFQKVFFSLFLRNETTPITQRARFTRELNSRVFIGKSEKRKTA